MRQGAEQAAPTSLFKCDNCITMLIIVNHIRFSYYSSYLFTSYGMITLLIPNKRYSWWEKVLESVSLFVKSMEKTYILCLQEVNFLSTNS